MATPDDKRMLAYIRVCDNPAKLRQIIENARKRDAKELAEAAFRKLVSIVPAEEPGTLEHDFWQSIQAFEYVLTEENGRTTRLSRTRQKVQRVGILQTLADWAIALKESDGFRMLIERGMPDLSGEAVILRHPDRFEPHIVVAAHERISAAEIPPSSSEA